MEDDDGLMIIGAKKSNEVKNYDKNDLQTCVNHFKKFAFCENGELLNKEHMSNLCLTGEIDSNFIRPLVWKTFLNVISINNKIEDWVNQVVRQRQDFKGKLKNLNALKKFSGDPLGGSNDSGWNSFFEENELKKIVNLDVNRTYQDKDLFQNTQIKEMMVNILFIWSKENRDISYKQGMNEILAVLLFGLYPFYFKNNPKISQDNVINYLKTDRAKFSKEIYLFFHDEEDLAADLFSLFDAVMNKGIKDLYDNGINKKTEIASYKKYELFQQQWTDEDDANNKLPLHKRCTLIIKEKLKVIDEELYNHFIKIDLNCTIFLQRWLKCIFNREFHPRDVIVIWDAIISQDLSDSLNLINESYSFMFIDFIAVAMMNYIREDLLRKDQNDCFQRLFKYPPIESPVTLIKLAIQIKELLFKKKRKREQIVNNQNIVKSSHDKDNTKNIGKTSSSKSNGDDLTLNKAYSANSENIKSNSTSSIKNLPNLETNQVGPPKSIIIEESKIKQEDKKSNQNKCIINDDDTNTQIVNRLEELYKKYKNIFESDDASDFETILDALKSNLTE